MSSDAMVLDPPPRSGPAEPQVEPQVEPPVEPPAAVPDSADLAIRIRGLGKAYHVFDRPEDRLKQLVLGSYKQYYREFWALRDVDLDIRRGEAVGIVGRNGSGKSTLLQMICGTLSPTCGDVQVRGRVAALLELGAGFNPDFSGRDNVFLNGAILGLGRGEMARRFDAIAAFADIGQFIDQPVKTYSSGMYSRLAFAVAINVDPEILVIDEALSVGDEAFQRKCFGRLRAIRDAGATVLFVSHSAGSVVQLCDRAVLLDSGRRLLTADPKTTVAKYQRLAYAPADRLDRVRDEIRKLDADLATTGQASRATASVAGATLGTGAAPPVAPPNDAVHAGPAGSHFDPNLRPQSTVSYEPRGALIWDAVLLDQRDRRVNILIPGATYRYRYTATFEEEAFGVRFGMMIKTVTGVELAGGTSHADAEPAEHIAAGRQVTVTFEFQNQLAPATYFLNAGILARTDQGETWLHRVLDIAMFRVEPAPNSLATGMVNLMSPNHCQITEVPTNAPTGGPAREPAGGKSAS